MKLKVDIASDFVCPWCYIGKRRFDAAVSATHTGPLVSIEWKAFQLSPDLPPEGVDRRAYLEKKFGTESLSRMNSQLSELGKEEGIDFQFERIKISPNTFEAHRLTWLAKQENKQDAIVDAIFSAYFSEGLDIGSPAVLRNLGERCGIASERLSAFFESTEAKAEVKNEVNWAQERGITLVPFFVLNDEHWISGADTVETFSGVLRELTASLGNRPAAP